MPPNFFSRRIVGPPAPQQDGAGQQGGAGDGTSSPSDGGGDVSSPVLPCQKGPPEKKPVRVRVSLFYDGTGNNRVNVGLGTGFSKDDSYAGGLSNIARLELEGLGGQKGPGVDVHFTVYTEGIATRDAGSDSTRGNALGTGETGVDAKVERGISEVVNNLRKLQKDYGKIEQLHIDTFGFSRGAAAARYCIWKCMQEAKTTLKERVEAFLLLEVGEVSVKFVGLYDTVASYGLKHTDDTQELHLDAISLAEHVVQLAAAEEHRANFRLTNINSAGGKGKQLFLPGVHSDVGGGYAASENEKDREVFDLDTSWLGAEGKAALARERQWLIASGWYRREELSETNFWNEIKANRTGIKNTYSHIPLLIMAEFARKHGVPIAPTLEDQYTVPPALSDAETAIQKYVGSVGESSPGDWFKMNPALEPQWHRDMRHDYLHFSARYRDSYGAHSPQWSKGGPLKGRRERIIQDG